MSDPTTSHTEPSRPAYYLTADDALAFARYHHHVPGARGWSQALMDENLPGWNVNEVMHLLQRHLLIGRTADERRQWLRPEVLGVVIDGDSLMRDTGTLQHPAKTAARRRVSIGSTSRHVRHLIGDAPRIVVHVRTAACTDDEHLLHQVARETYHASPVRPSLVLNVSGALIDPFDPPTDEHSREFADHYQADVCSLLRRVRESKSKVVLATFVVHDDGEPVEVRRTGPEHLPPKLRTDRTGIRSVMVGVRADALRGELRAEVVERLERLVGRGELAMR